MPTNVANPENIDEAKRAKVEGRRLMKAGDFAKAAKMFEISLRLNDNPDTKQLIGSAKAAMARMRGPRSRRDSSSAVNGDSNGTGLRIRIYTESFLRWLEGLSRIVADTHIGRQLINLENRYITPLARPYVRGMIPIALLLFVWKVVLRRKLTLGLLPGDVYYSSTRGSSSVFISAPIVSCMLISFLLNAIFRALNINQVR
jgi:Protein of unknown function (DUF2905)